ncbi:LodA/GoxA family CTQ-dependent oxidase [Kordiimonas sp.]|uniref:LodA/GoxA family CTQ-dependent oxidase n=1 Tax=Kordiimonas sp. TaxID=1970157 RepID=UPI003A94BA29
MSDTYFRVHPNINFARVGNSKEYYIAPETAAGDLIDKKTGLFGGLPIKPGTEDTPIEAADFRDNDQNVKRQAARFRIYAYDSPQEEYPAADGGHEVQVGDTVGGKKITDIVWTVHLANKKNNFYQITSANGEEEGINAYKGINPDTGKPNHPPVRDPSFGDDLANTTRRSQLVIDAGPRAIHSASGAGTAISFDANTPCKYADSTGKVHDVPNYPVSFPDDHFNMYQYDGAIDTLGELEIEKGTGRLIVAGAYGRASGIIQPDGNAPAMTDPIDNDYWFDDTSDGPVNAVVVFDDGSTQEVVGGWVVTTDPGYAPQTRNVVSTWDDMFNTWVEELGLIPSLYSGGQYQPSYQASFYGDILPVFHGAFLQRWNTSLPDKGVNGHNYMAQISYQDNPKERIPNFKDLLRDPNNPDEDGEGVKMPLALGDATKSFLSLSPTQYFLMMQWYDGVSVEDAPAIGGGEALDRDVLHNCLGGRYSPGIDLTFIVRDVNLYKQSWQGETGPFRVNQQPLDYTKASKDEPFLGVGYVPLQKAMVEPGDLCKFMSQPWHTDYNSCAVHEPDPNPRQNNTLYWSWPAQRPVQVHPANLCTFDTNNKVWNLGGQLFSVRGDGEGADNGTHTNYPQNEGRYQLYPDFVANWHKVGFIIQGTQIPADQGSNYGADKFLEVASLFTSNGDVVQPWPTSAIPKAKS